MIQNLRMSFPQGFSLLACIFVFGMSACSSTQKDLSPSASSPIEGKKPKKPEEEKKPPEEKWVCKISNGEGRVFRASEENRIISEAKARQECQLYSRRCILLDCSPITVEE